MKNTKEEARKKRHKRIRKRLLGTEKRPRLCVFCSNKNMHIQLIDDIKGRSLFSISTLDSEFKKGGLSGGNIKSAEALGELLAKRLLDKGITAVVFDRGGYLYHGRVKAVGEAVRKAGIK